MDIFKIIFFSISAAFLSIVLRQYKSEYAVGISLVAGIIIFVYISGYISDIFQYISDLCNNVGISKEYMVILFKITGLSYLCEFSSALCKDAGENAISVKIDIAAKVALIYMAMPIFKQLINAIWEVAI